MPDSNLSELAPQVAIVFMFLYFLWRAGTKFVEALDRLTDAQRDSVKATENLAVITEQKYSELVASTDRAAQEAAERNGHLGEQNIQITEMIANHTEKMTEQFSHVNRSLEKQTVKEQLVEHQTVKE